MRDTAPKALGILLIAAVFGFIGGAVGFVMYGYGIAWSFFIMLIVGTIVAVALALGWREPKIRPMGHGIGPVTPRPAYEGGRDRPGSPAPRAAAAGSAPPTSTAPRAAEMDSTPATPTRSRTTDTSTAGSDTTTPAQPYDVSHGEAVVQTPSGAAVTHSAGGAKPAEPATAPADAAPADRTVKPSARLAGQEDLAARKGNWRYSGDKGASEVEAMPDADTGATAHPGAAGTSEAEARQPGASVADKPPVLSAPRDGGPDDLKQIKGVGPRLEETLHEMGIYHFDQIAAWSATEIAWMDDNLKGFKGRVTRDDWIPQARTLADGGETEFSRRADRDGTYDA